MTSWRDGTPQPVQEDLDVIAGAAVEAAQRLLEEDGEFFPFGIVMTTDGVTRMVASDPGLGERPRQEGAIDALYAEILGEQARLRAAAVVADVRVGGSDALQVRFEHRDGGPAMELVLRYMKKRSRIDYRISSVSVAERQVWSLAEIAKVSDVSNSCSESGGASGVGCWGVVPLLILVPLFWVVALAMLWAGSFLGSMGGPIPLSAGEVRTARILVIGAGLCASGPFAVAAWMLRKNHQMAFWLLVVMAALIMVASLGWAVSLPRQDDYTVF